MTHSEMDELYELVLMGVLEPPEATEVAEHVNRSCDYCQGQLRDSSYLLAALATTAELQVPPFELREKVLAVAGQKSRPVHSPQTAWTGWRLAFGLASAAALVFLLFGLMERNNLERTRTQLTEVSRQRNELRAAVAILSEADTRSVKFGELQNEPHGRVFVSRSGGVVFVGSRLPDLAAGKTFELWLVPAKGNPQAAGLFTTNAQGISVNVLARSVDPAVYAAVAVSIEPEGGSAQPTSKPILVVPLA